MCSTTSATARQLSLCSAVSAKHHTPRGAIQRCTGMALRASVERQVRLAMGAEAA